MNNATLIGYLTYQPELRKTHSGKSVVNFTVAINRGYDKEQVDFIPVVAWEKTAENIVNHLNKGSRVSVEGSIQTRSYENEVGKRVNVVEVVAKQVTFLDGKPKQDSMFGSDFILKDIKEEDEEKVTIDIHSDDLPF